MEESKPIPFPPELKAQLVGVPDGGHSRTPLLTDESFDRVLKVVAHHAKTSASALMEKNRQQPVAEARMIAYWTLRNRTKNFDGSMPGWSQIGRRLHRDHGAVMHGVKRVDSLCQIDKKFRSTLLKVIRDL